MFAAGCQSAPQLVDRCLPLLPVSTLGLFVWQVNLNHIKTQNKRIQFDELMFHLQQVNAAARQHSRAQSLKVDGYADRTVSGSSSSAVCQL